MHIQNCIKIHPLGLKILRKNTFLHQSRAITLLFINEFSSFAIPYHSSLISMSMQNLKKICQKRLKLESGNDSFISIKGHNSVVYERILPICNPKPLLPDIMTMQSLKKIGQKLLMLESGNEALTDGQTLKIFGGYNIIPRHFLGRGMKSRIGEV